jgi:hypothetical protein
MTLHTDTARLILRKVAAGNGWVRHGQASTWDRDIYVRDEVMVNLRFGTRGALTFGERHGAGVSDVTSAHGKRETVVSWLTTDTDAAVPAVQVGTESPADDTLGQAVTGARKATLGALEQLTDLATLLEAERESHRAEVIRLVERAEAAELETQEATEAEDGEVAQLEDRVAELEAKLSAVKAGLGGKLARVETFRARLANLDGAGTEKVNAFQAAETLKQILDS